MKESPKTVDTFIRQYKEAPIKKFFMEQIDAALAAYEPGLPAMKPDVLVQIKEIEAKRQEMMEEEMKKQQMMGPIVIHREGEPPIALSQQDVVNLMQQQNQQIILLQKQLKEEQEINNIRVPSSKPNGSIVFQEPGKPPTTLSQQEVANIMYNQHEHIQKLQQNQERITELEEMVTQLQKQLIERIKTSQAVSVELTALKQKLQETISAVSVVAPILAQSQEPPKTPEVFQEPAKPRLKSEPEIVINI